MDDDLYDGALGVVPAGSTNGTAIGTKPVPARGVLIDLGAADSISYTIARDQPTAAPAATVTRSGADMRRVDEPLGPQSNVYVTSKSGTPTFRFY